MKWKVQVVVTMIMSMMALSVSRADAVALELGEYAPCAVLDGLEPSGTEINQCIRMPLEEASEKRYTVLKFFSVHCGSCHKLHGKFVARFKDSPELLNNAVINYIGIDRDKAAIRRYAQKKTNDLEVLGASVFFDHERAAKKAYGVMITPTTFVLDRHADESCREFKVVYKHVGMMDADEMEEFISSFRDE